MKTAALMPSQRAAYHKLSAAEQVPHLTSFESYHRLFPSMFKQERLPLRLELGYLPLSSIEPSG